MRKFFIWLARRRQLKLKQQMASALAIENATRRTINWSNRMSIHQEELLTKAASDHAKAETALIHLNRQYPEIEACVKTVTLIVSERG